jgi:acetyl esterase/lipase
MKKISTTLFLIACILKSFAQTDNPNKKIVPNGTVIYGNIAYANDTSESHKLDIYMPGTGKKSHPLIIWLHGGGWRKGDKYSDMNYMPNTVKAIINHGYAIASINYRYSTDAKFPAQIQDCNQAVEFLYQNAAKYGLDRNRIALMGFSAGGHLAALLGLSNNNSVSSFYPDGLKPHFKIKLVFNYFGINDLNSLKGPGATDPHSGVTLLLGSSAADRPDLAKYASPVSYIDKNDPPFLIIHGDKDEAVDLSQSTILSLKLNQAHIKNELVVVPGAPHAGEMFDTADIHNNVLKYLQFYLK